MKNLTTFLCLSLAFAANCAFASGDGPSLITPPPPESYHCHIIVFADDLKDGYVEQNFVAVAQATQTHGGQQYIFTLDKYKVSLLANDRWMGISWSKGQELIGETVFLRTQLSQEAQVLMLFNPKNSNEYASLDCQP